jgi:hypothetical protein
MLFSRPVVDKTLARSASAIRGQCPLWSQVQRHLIPSQQGSLPTLTVHGGKDCS